MKKLSLFLIKLYQITPLHSHSMCRFIPTCSEYTKLKIEEYGFFKGLYLGIKRILKCHPGCKSGYDM